MTSCFSTPIATPGGQLTYKTGSNRTTTWITEYLIKQPEDVELIEKYMPVAKLNKQAIAAEYDRIGDAGHPARLRLGRPGRLLAACLLPDGRGAVDPGIHGPPRLGSSAPAALLERKLRFIEESLAGAKFDLIETGGGAGSDTVFRRSCIASSACPTTARFTMPCIARPPLDLSYLRRHDAYPGPDRRERHRCV